MVRTPDAHRSQPSTTVEVTDPVDTVAERAVVGAALLGHTGVLGGIDPAVDLTDPRLVEIVEACLALRTAGRRVEPAAVLATLRARGLPWSATSSAAVFVAELTSVETVPVPAAADWHARTVREAGARRRVARTVVRLAAALDRPGDQHTLTALLAAEYEECLTALHRVDDPSGGHCWPTPDNEERATDDAPLHRDAQPDTGPSEIARSESASVR